MKVFDVNEICLMCDFFEGGLSPASTIGSFEKRNCDIGGICHYEPVRVDKRADDWCGRFKKKTKKKKLPILLKSVEEGYPNDGMKFSTTGNVGVGVVNPNQKLHIV